MLFDGGQVIVAAVMAGDSCSPDMMNVAQPKSPVCETKC